MNKYLSIIPLLLISLLLPGCIPQTVGVYINTYADENSLPNGFIPGKKFAIWCATDKNHLLAQEISKKIANFLTYKGFEVSSIEDADYYLAYGFNVSSQKEILSVPKYIPGPSQIVNGNIYTGNDCIQYSQTTNTTGTTIYVPEEVTFYTKKLEILIYDLNTVSLTNTKELWQGSAAIVNQRSDLREAIDYLLIASFKNFGKSTCKQLYEVYKTDQNKINNF